MKYCTYCGKALGSQSFCTNCGRKVDTAKDSTVKPVRKTDNAAVFKVLPFWIGWIVFLISAICQCVCCLLGLNGYLSFVDSIGGSFLYGILYSVIGIESLAAAVIIFFMRRNRFKYGISVVLTAISAVYTLAMLLLIKIPSIADLLTILQMYKEAAATYESFLIFMIPLNIIAVSVLIVGRYMVKASKADRR